MYTSRVRLLWPVMTVAALVYAPAAWPAPRVYTPPERPRVFPAQTDFTIPLGTAQLFLPYLETPADLPLDDYHFVVDMPTALKLVAVDGKAGVEGRVVSQRESGARRIVDVAIDNPFWGGMELSICWGDKTGSTISYVPALRVAGTWDWRKVSATLRSPASAVGCRPLLIKWQKRGLVGAAYFDNIVVRKKGSDKNLLPVGAFEEPYWRDHPNSHVVEVDRDGQRTHAGRVQGDARGAHRQDALWLGEGFPIEPSTEYVFEALVKCERVRSLAGAPTRAALLLRLDDPRFRGGEIRFGFVAHGGQVVEAKQSAQVRALPGLLGKRPERSRIVPCHYREMFDASTSAAVVENVRQSGITGLYGRLGNAVSDAVQAAGGKIIWSFPYNGWQSTPARDLLKEHPEWQALEFKGSRQWRRVCPTYALDPKGEFAPKLQAWVREQVKDTPYDEVDVDYEVPVVDPPTFCFCPRCLAAFRAEAKLSADAPLDAKTVVEQHREAWTAFRCRQNAELIGCLARWIRSENPGLHVSVYSGHQCLRTREHYGVDWSLLAPHIDLGIAGYGISKDGLARTREALGRTRFMGGEMYYLSFSSATRGPVRRQGWKMRLLRCYVNSGCDGVLIWWLPVLDGQGYFETSQAAAVIADFEPFFKDGQRVDSRVHIGPHSDRCQYAAFAHQGQVLLLVFNGDKQEQRVAGLSVQGWQGVSVQRYDDVLGRLGPAGRLPEPFAVPARDAAVLLLSQAAR